MASPDTQANDEPSNLDLTPQDLKDREDFKYLLSIMEKQGAVGITQPIDYIDSMRYRDSLATFEKQITPEGSITELFDDIIFDFDGVLYDSTYAAYRALELTLEKKADKSIPTPSTIEDIANSYHAPFQSYYKRFGITLSTPEEIHSFRDTYREVQAQVNNEHHTPATIYPEVKEVLDKIKESKRLNPKIRVHIVSAGSEKQIRTPLIEAGIINDFDEIHSECHDKAKMIQTIIDKSEDRKTVMIGDLPSDIKDAQLVGGVKTVAVARGKRERGRLSTYLPDYVIGDLSELFDLKSLSRELREA